MPSSTSTSNLHAADAPLPAGTLLENLGLGLVIVCTKVSYGCLIRVRLRSWLIGSVLIGRRIK